MVKVDSKIMKEFVNTASIAGKIESVIFNFTNNGLEVNTVVEGNIGATVNILNKQAFKEYNIEPIKIGIKDTKLLMNILNSFIGEVELEITEEILRISNSKKKAELINMKPEFVENILPEESKEALLSKFDGGVEISTEIFFNSVKNASILGVEQFKIICKDKKLSIEVGENNFNKIVETIDCDYKDFETKYDSIFKDVTGILNEKVKISTFGNYSPLLITKKTGYGLHKIMISPLSE